MHRPVMSSTEGDCELIADLATERAGLGESEMVGVRGAAVAQKARLLGDITKVLPVAITPRRSDREDALVDALRIPSVVCVFGGGHHLWPSNLRHGGTVVRGCNCIG